MIGMKLFHGLIACTAAVATAAAAVAENKVLRIPASGAAVNVAYRPIQSAPSLTSAFTVEFWARLDAPVPGRIFNKRGCSCGGLTLHVSNINGQDWGIHLELSGVYGSYNHCISLPIGEWHHCAIVWSAFANRLDCYRDGVLVSSITPGGSVLNLCGDSPVRFGEHCGWGMVGAMDNIRYWSVARTAEQVASSMAIQYSPAQALQQTGLIGSWTFEDNTAADGTGNNITGTAENGANINGDPSLPLNPPSPPCPADVDDSGTVNGVDLAVVLTNWGIPSPKYPGADVNDDGVVDGTDLATVLAGWGACP